MTTKVTLLPRGLFELSVSVPWVELHPYLKAAAKKIVREKPIPGFRPASLNYEMVKKEVGEMKIIEKALPEIVQETYTKAITSEALETIGPPDITFRKIVPSAPVEYTAKGAVLPAVALPNLQAIKIQRKTMPVEEPEVEKELLVLQRMRRQERKVNRGATTSDKVVVDLDIFLNGVPLEGGQARGHGIYLQEPYYIPGLNQELVGLQAGDRKEFQLRFPETHYQKHLQGKLADFKVAVKEVFELTAPPLDDSFAKTLGQENILALKSLLRKNLEEEKRFKEEERLEEELFSKIISESKISEIPEILVRGEVERMIGELFSKIREQGIDPAEYLGNLHKKSEDLTRDFLPQAEKRVKAALILRNLAREAKIEGKDQTEIHRKALEMLKTICIR